jgi:hypothetical protein
MRHRVDRRRLGPLRKPSAGHAFNLTAKPVLEERVETTVTGPRGAPFRRKNDKPKAHDRRPPQPEDRRLKDG